MLSAIALVLFVIASLVVALQFPSVQNYITDKAAHYVSKKAGTQVTIGEINVAFPKDVVIKSVYVEDQSHDSLLYAGRLAVDIGLFSLFDKKISVNKIAIENTTAHLKMSLPDSQFNFQFIIDSLSGSKKNKNTKPKDTASTKGWDFTIHGISLDQIFFTYVDDVSGMDMGAHLGSLDVEINKFNLDQLAFGISRIQLANTKSHFYITKESPPDTSTSKGKIPQLEVNNIEFSNVGFVFRSIPDKIKLDTYLKSMDLTVQNFDLKHQKINVDQLLLDSANVAFALGTQDTIKYAAQSLETSSNVHSSEDWTIKGNLLKVNNSNFKFDDDNQPNREKGIDYGHLALSGIKIEMEQAGYAGIDSMTGIVKRLSLNEKSGIRLRKMEGDIKVLAHNARIKNLDLEMNNSRIGGDASVDFPSLIAIAEDIPNLGFHVDLNSTKITLHDISYFVPDISDQLPMDTQNLVVFTSANIYGKVKNLNIDRLYVSTATNTSLVTHGKILGLPDIETTHFDLPQIKLTSSSRDVRLLLDTLLPSGFSVPEKFTLKSSFIGSIQSFKSTTNVQSNFGDILADVKMHNVLDTVPTYVADIKARHFNLGKFLEDTATLGKVSVSANLNGKYFDFNKMQGEFKVTIPEAELYHYNYKNITLSGNLKQQILTSQAAINDTNIVLNFNGQISLNPRNPYYKTKLNLEGADFQALKLAGEDVRASGILTTDIKGKSLNDINGTIDVRDVLVVKNNQKYPVDSLLLVSVMDDDNTSIEINSNILYADFSGNMHLADLPMTFKHHFDHYFDLNDTVENNNGKLQKFDFELRLKEPGILADVLIPDLEYLEPGTIKGSYNSELLKLDLQGDIPQITYSGIHIDSFFVSAHSNRNNLLINTGFSGVSSSFAKIYKTSIKTNISNDNIRTSLETKDSAGVDRVYIASNITSLEKELKIHFFPDSFILNYESWKIPETNYLLFNDSFYAHDFKLENKGQVMELRSLTSQKYKPLEISFHNFDVNSIASAFISDENLITGILEGNLQMKKIDSLPFFSSDIKVKNFSFKGDTLGTVALKAETETGKQVNFDLGVKSNVNALNVSGAYDANDLKNKLIADVNISKLDLSTIESYTMNQLSDLKGMMSGKLKVAGNLEQPNVTGKVNFRDAAFNLGALNTYFRLQDEDLVFDENGLKFSNFKITDSIGNNAIVNGYVKTGDYRNFSFDMRVKTDDFLALNTTSKVSGLFYGKLIIDSDIDIKGDIYEPVVTMTARIDKKTKVYFIVPTMQADVIEREGIVQFIDVDQKINPILARKESTDTVAPKLTGIDLSSNIEIEKGAGFNIIVDESTNERLEMNGEGTLSFGIDRSGKQTLTGIYQIVDGKYYLNFQNVVKKQFDIKPGSSIRWSGELTQAQVDITAIYKVRTSPFPLMASGSGDADNYRFKQELPFLVNLKMSDNLMNPKINFSIELPDEQKGAFQGQVATKLGMVNEQESEVNKQVFALLVLNRFMSENPFSGGGGGTNLARSSVSKILTQQLNALSEKYIKGVELSFDVQSYQGYENEGTTELNVALRKQLLNDRLTVQVGSNFDIENNNTQQQNQWNDLAGDISLIYDLSGEGRYKLKAFRQSTYEGILQGEVVETGISFIFIRDYNNFSDLLKSRKNKEDGNKNSKEKPDGALKEEEQPNLNED